MYYFVKWIRYPPEIHPPHVIPIVLQAVNGPCPLLAICNVLFARGHLHLHPDTKQVSFDHLCTLLKAHLQMKLEETILKGKDGANESKVANSIMSYEDSVRLLPRLEEGLDVNVIFASPLRFEFTAELSLFDAFDIRLVHGWVYDPDDMILANAMAMKSYNEVVNILTSDDDEEEKKPTSTQATTTTTTTSTSAPALVSASTPPPPYQPPASTSSPTESSASSEATPTAQPSDLSSSSTPSTSLESATALSSQEPVTIQTQQSESISVTVTPPSTSIATSETTIAAVSSSSTAPASAPAAASASASSSSSSSSSASSSTLPSSSPSLPPTASRPVSHQSKSVLRSFLAETSGQLTRYGLHRMKLVLRDDECCVHFRNNHFSMVVKRQGRLFSLVTDAGILSAAPYIVWQELGGATSENEMDMNISGDDPFLDDQFRIPQSNAVDFVPAHMDSVPSLISVTPPPAGTVAAPPQKVSQTQPPVQPQPQPQAQTLVPTPTPTSITPSQSPSQSPSPSPVPIATPSPSSSPIANIDPSFPPDIIQQQLLIQAQIQAENQRKQQQLLQQQQQQAAKQNSQPAVPQPQPQPQPQAQTFHPSHPTHPQTESIDFAAHLTTEQLQAQRTAYLQLQQQAADAKLKEQKRKEKEKEKDKDRCVIS